MNKRKDKRTKCRHADPSPRTKATVFKSAVFENTVLQSLNLFFADKVV